jgi:hypothetical protein
LGDRTIECKNNLASKDLAEAGVNENELAEQLKKLKKWDNHL